MAEEEENPKEPLVLADGKTVAKMTEEERRAFAIELLKRISNRES